VDFRIDIKGLQEAQRHNAQMIRALRTGGPLGEGVRAAGAYLHSRATIVTHVDTGALRASHRMIYRQFFGSPSLEISIDKGAMNPRSRARTAVYGPVEHARGGSHAFYERTYREHGDRAATIGMAAALRSIP
jgi:hypothetical protein